MTEFRASDLKFIARGGYCFFFTHAIVAGRRKGVPADMGEDYTLRDTLNKYPK